MAHPFTHKVKTASCGSTENMFHRSVFSPKVLTAMSITGGDVGGSAEFPKDRGSQNQIHKRAKMKNVSWKRKKKEEKPDVFLIYKGVTFHPWRVNKGILE